MSIWTHVAAIVRIDALRLPGMPNQAPQLENNVPFGSEGGLCSHLFTNQDEHSLAAYTAMIWGDLRDYDDVSEVISYLNRVTDGLMVRQGIAEIAVEGRDIVLVFYDDENKKWVTA